ncbi:hypothetical protein SLI_6764 [Streptomyces lividans 1326]|uniref:Uncharacterized protein n=1 Tax=Streptomyces lividans 1326 TaxID=1200984 RepID=A0A7U9DZW7_STRLI|nr:hypothetical protein SLI_6764 [Streptomyces lividans 1326]
MWAWTAECAAGVPGVVVRADAVGTAPPGPGRAVDYFAGSSPQAVHRADARAGRDA